MDVGMICQKWEVMTEKVVLPLQTGSGKFKEQYIPAMMFCNKLHSRVQTCAQSLVYARERFLQITFHGHFATTPNQSTPYPEVELLSQPTPLSAVAGQQYASHPKIKHRACPRVPYRP